MTYLCIHILYIPIYSYGRRMRTPPSTDSFARVGTGADSLVTETNLSECGTRFPRAPVARHLALPLNIEPPDEHHSHPTSFYLDAPVNLPGASFTRQRWTNLLSAEQLLDEDYFL